MLWTAAGRCGPSHRDGRQRREHQLMVVAVGPSITAPSVMPRPSVNSERLTLRLPLSVGVRPVFPHPAAPYPSPRPVPAKSNRSLAERRKPAAPRARTPQRPRPLPIPEAVDGPRRTSKSQSPAAHSTDIRSAARRSSYPSPPGFGHPRVMAAQRVLQAGWQQRLHLCPDRVWQAPAVIPDAPTHLLQSNLPDHPVHMGLPQ